MEDDSIDVTATCVRVPIVTSHAVQMNVTLDSEATVDEVKKHLKVFLIVVMDNPENNSKF